ncbi:hypothetical protein [Cohnella yongneupensis]|uniref:HNH endonuclease n=1 Tax=Cohnella yongneupensis TaxID=425006 RepID=A0ABW0R696_9BACL
MKKDDFMAAVDKLKEDARVKGLSSVTITAGNVHRLVGGYPGKSHRMPHCCETMRGMMQFGDSVVSAPPSGLGASLTIRYQV